MRLLQTKTFVVACTVGDGIWQGDLVACTAVEFGRIDRLVIVRDLIGESRRAFLHVPRIQSFPLRDLL